jgi:peptidoglycan/LPS O-acetylase OafA/YrhL
LLFLRSRRQKPNSLLLYGAIVATLAILFTAQRPWVSLLAIPFTVLVYELAMGNSWCANLLGTKTFVLLGGASYAIYLLQVPVRSWIHYAVTG